MSTLEHLPAWATWTCIDCDEPFLPGYGCVWSSKRPEGHSHGGLKRCREQLDAMGTVSPALAAQINLMHQAIIEANGTLGRLVVEADDENWNEEVATAVFSATHSLERGEEAHKLVHFTATESVG